MDQFPFYIHGGLFFYRDDISKTLSKKYDLKNITNKNLSFENKDYFSLIEYAKLFKEIIGIKSSNPIFERDDDFFYNKGKKEGVLRLNDEVFFPTEDYIRRCVDNIVDERFFL